MSVVIPSYNAAATIGEQLDSLVVQRYRGDWEVVVSDNGSTDSTRDVVKGWMGRLPGLRIVDSSDRRGPAHARNVGAQAAKGDLIAYCDADDVADPDWLVELVRAAQEAHLVGGILENELLNAASVRDWRRNLGTTTLEKPLGFLPCVVSANCAIRRDVLQRLGGWPEDYPYCEDVELSWRAQLADYRLAFATGAIMHYRHRDSLRGMARQVYNYGFTEPRLYRDYRSRGARRRSPREIAGSYFYIATRLPYLVLSTRRRGFWFVVAAGNWGRLMGSFRFRVLCL